MVWWLIKRLGGGQDPSLQNQWVRGEGRTVFARTIQRQRKIARGVEDAAPLRPACKFGVYPEQPLSRAPRPVKQKQIKNHSYRSASIGSSFAALLAG